MKETKVLLVQLAHMPDWPPFSCETLGGSILDHCPGSSVQILTFNPFSEPQILNKFSNLLQQNEFDIVGISVPQGTKSSFDSVINVIKKDVNAGALKAPVVILGNYLPAAFPEMFFSSYPDALISVGWGERTITTLVNQVHNNAFCPNDIPNLIFFRDNQICKTRMEENIAPSVPLTHHPTAPLALVESSRGCHYGKCQFCVRPNGVSKNWSRINLETVMQSIRNIRDRGIRYFTFVDEDFIAEDLEGARVIAEKLKNMKDISFSFSTRVDSIFNPKDSISTRKQREDLLDCLIDAGLCKLFVGVESLSDTQLQRYGKGFSTETAIKAINIIEKKGLDLEMGFILFDPLLTIKEIQHTSQNLEKYGLWRYTSVFLNEMRVHKNTFYERRLQREGVLGKFDYDNACYDWICKDPRVQAIRMNCALWSKETKPLYKLLRNLERSKQEEHLGTLYAEKLRYLNLVFLKDSLNQVLNGKTVLSINPEISNKYKEILSSLEENFDSKLKINPNSTLAVLKKEMQRIRDS